MSCHPFCNQTGRENGKGDTEITIISFFVFNFTVEKICENTSYKGLLFKTATSLRLTEGPGKQFFAVVKLQSRHLQH